MTNTAVTTGVIALLLKDLTSGTVFLGKKRGRKLAHYTHVHYTLALTCSKNHIIIFCSLLDIQKNIVPSFSWPTLYIAPSVSEAVG